MYYDDILRSRAINLKLVFSKPDEFQSLDLWQEAPLKKVHFNTILSPRNMLQVRLEVYLFGNFEDCREKQVL